MNPTRIFTLSFLSICLLISIWCSDESAQTFYVKSVRCNISESFAFPNTSCYPKSYSRNFSTVNIIVTLKHPMHVVFVSSFVNISLFKGNNFLKVEIRMLFKYGVIYREVMHTPKLSWCGLMNRKIENKMIEQVIQVLRDNSPSIIHECPYTVKLKRSSDWMRFWKLLSFQEIVMKNASMNLKNLVPLLPTGDYKIFTSGFDNLDFEFWRVQIVFSVMSSNKDTFGWRNILQSSQIRLQ